MTSDPGTLGLHPMTKVEVVVNGADVEAVRTVFEEAGASGFTMLGNVAGFGHHGFHEGRLAFNDRDGLVMLITVVPRERAASIVGPIRTLLANRPGVMFVSEAHVLRREYFER